MAGGILKNLLMPDRNHSSDSARTISILFNAGCVMVINLAFLLLYLKSFSALINHTYVREMWLLVNVCAVPALAMTSIGRHDQRAMVLDKVARSSIFAVIVHALCFMSLTAFLHLEEFSVLNYVFFYGMMLAGLLIFKISAAYVLKEYRRHGYNFIRVVIIGTGASAERLASAMLNDAGYGYKILAFFDDSPDRNLSVGKVYPMSELAGFVADNEVKQIFYTISGHHESLTEVIKVADDNCVDFYYVPQIPRTVARSFDLHAVGHIPVLSIRHNPLSFTLNRVAKRAFDIIVSGTFLCLYPLVYIPVAIGIKLGSPGPVYFRQERTGYLGRPFKCLKFRTMRVNAASDRVQATKDDPRKTPLGDFLRRSSIDELPQFINVLRGDMSIVGPRPHMLAHTEQYAELIDRYMLRHSVKPGITGWAQVNGYRGPTDELWKMERRVEYDVWYIENWSLLLDLKIMVRTVINALHHDENAF